MRLEKSSDRSIGIFPSIVNTTNFVTADQGLQKQENRNSKKPSADNFVRSLPNDGLAREV